jgi:hypothetical protein
MTDELEIEIPADTVPDDPTDGVDDDDPPIEPVPVDGTPEDGVTPALFVEDLDPESEVRP